MIDKDFKNLDRITEFDGLYLASPIDIPKFLRDSRINCVHRPSNSIQITKRNSPFLIVIEAKRHVFHDWKNKINQLRHFQQYILDAKNIDKPGFKFTEEFRKNVNKFELYDLTPEMYLYFGGERFVADQNFLVQLANEGNKLKQQNDQIFPIHIGYIKPDGERYGIFNLHNEQFVESKNSKVNSLTTGSLTISRTPKQSGGTRKGKK